MVGMRKTALRSFLGLVQFSCVLLLVSTYATADYHTLVEMEAPSEVEISVEPGLSNWINVDANVTPYWGMVTVWFSANCSMGEVRVAPSLWTIINRTQVSIYIRMPYGTSSYERPIVDIYASDEEDPTNETQKIHTMNVTILPYSRVRIISERSVRRVLGGESTTFDLKINNTGNMHDNYTLNVINTEELEEEGITVELTDTIALQEGEEREVKINVHTSSDTAIGPHTIWVRTETMDSEGQVWQEYPLILEVKINPIQVLILPSAIVMVVIAVMLGTYFLTKRK